MRAFGIFAAFTAFTAVFAAPIAAPAPAPATANSIAVRADGAVPANIASVITDLQGDVNGVIQEILTALTDAKNEASVVIPVIEPLLGKLVSDLAGAAGKVGLNALGNLFNFGGASNGMSISDFVALMKTLEGDLVDVLCKIATLIQQDYPEVAATIQTIISVLNMLSGAISEVVGDSSLDLSTPLSEIIKPLLALMGISIPGLKA